MRNFILNNIGAILLILIVGILAITNYTPGTYLMGWDNLQTDLYPWLGVKRALWSGWQEYQSFGLPAGMAHASDLVRAVFVWVLSFILPTSFIRYFVHFFLILVGTLGARKLILFVLEYQKETSKASRIPAYAAFIGALFFLLSWGTTQILYFAYDGFTLFFGLLPWEIYVFLSALTDRSNNKWKLILFMLVNILATSQAYSQQLFVTYGMLLLVLATGVIVNHRFNMWQLINKSSLLFMLIIAMNAFWILPQMYYLATNASVGFQAKINQIHTSKTVLENKEQGGVSDFLAQNGFYVEYVDLQGKYHLSEWLTHRNGVVMRVLIGLFALLPIFSLFWKSKLKWPWLFAYALCLIVLMNNTPVTSFIDDILRKLPFYNQVFRTSFTKFASIYSLVLTVLLGASTETILRKIPKPKVLLVVMIGAIVFFGLPAFQGNIFSQQVKTKLPSAYLDLISYFKSVDPSARIAVLPDTSFWGWYKYSWGYNGSGFLWYGIEQPIVSRTFDVWSRYSEGYYWELRNAINTRNEVNLQSVFEKYGITYIIYDDTLISTENRDEYKEKSFLSEALSKHPYTKIANIPVFTSNASTRPMGNILVYATDISASPQSQVTLYNNLPNISQGEGSLSIDTAYAKYGPYISDASQSYDSIFPFSGFTTLKDGSSKSYEFTVMNNDATLSAHLHIPIKNMQPIFAPPYSEDAQIWNENNEVTTSSSAINSVSLLDDIVSITYRLGSVIKPPISMSSQGNFQKRGSQSITYDSMINTLHIEATDGAFPYWEYYIPNLPLDTAYLIVVEGNNINGSRQEPLITFMRGDNRNVILAKYLHDGTNYLVIPRNSPQSLGLVIAFSIASYKSMPVKYDLSKISVYPFPYTQTLSTELVHSEGVLQKGTMLPTISEARKDSYYSYHLRVNTNSNVQATLVLDQAFDPGWIAIQFPTYNSQFSMGDIKVLPHVRVNGWANAWKLQNSKFEILNSKSITDNKGLSTQHLALGTSTVFLLFWPQYLEYGGFGLLALSLGILGVRQVRKMKTTT